MAMKAATIGFGEAACAFADGWACAVPLATYDRLLEDPATARPIIAAAETRGVDAARNANDALAGRDLVLSLVTADQALAAARANAGSLDPHALWCDMNSVSPQTKRAAAAVTEGCGGRYVDVAVMAPVLPARRAVPLLVSGRHAADAAQALRAIGFADVTIVDGGVGAASAIKMIRSVMVKGIEALTAEMILAADAAGATDAVLASLDVSWLGADWRRRADYNLDRMMAHGTRRAAEMEEVAKTLDDLGIAPTMTRGAIERQRAIGALALTPPATLAAKVDAILDRRKDVAA